MKIQIRRFLIPVGLLAMAALLVAGCGGDDDTTTASTEAESETTASGGGGAAGASLTIKMGDYFFQPEAATAQAGKTTIEAPNEGTVEHELVLFKTNMDPADLPTDAEGNVDEGKLEEAGAEELGEIEDVEPGEAKSGKFNLTPGKYVMICNIPGHYARGMYGSLTVSE